MATLSHISRPWVKKAISRNQKHDKFYDSTAWRSIRRTHLAAEWYCRACKKEGLIRLGNVVDHIIPRNNGGSDNDDNLQTLCTSCHAKKSQIERK